MKLKERIKERITLSIVSIFLLMYMLFIFGPSEIFFANATEFQFLYGEFIFVMVLIALGVTLLGTLLFLLLPQKLYKVFASIMMGISLTGYVQVMILNKRLDLLGQNPDGYHVDTAQIIINTVIWTILITAVIFLCFYKEKIWKKTVVYLSTFLLLIQVVALVSLIATGKEDAYVRNTEADWHLSGDEQMTVSSKENVIVFILDYFSNQYIEPILNQYPDAFDCMKDFTYYNNDECVYFGTFASLPHMLTGCEEDPSIVVNEWCDRIWKDEIVNSFYQELKEQNYKVNLYTPDLNILYGTNDVSMLADKFSNMVNQYDSVKVDTKLLIKTLVKMSGYRMFPEFAKSFFYANMNEYLDIVSYENSRPQHYNSSIYSMLQEDGLQVDKKYNHLTIQHLMGLHSYINDAECNYVEKSTLEETGMGCMVMLEEYFTQMKELGIYDSATIIVTSDHGDIYDPQVIFFIKIPNETHEDMQISNAPISHCEFLPTLAKAAGLDATKYGQTIEQFSKDEQRERTYWLRIFDEKYPYIQNYTGEKEGASNVFYGYTYTGDVMDLNEAIQLGPKIVIPALDTMF